MAGDITKHKPEDVIVKVPHLNWHAVRREFFEERVFHDAARQHLTAHEGGTVQEVQVGAKALQVVDALVVEGLRGGRAALPYSNGLDHLKSAVAQGRDQPACRATVALRISAFLAVTQAFRDSEC